MNTLVLLLCCFIQAATPADRILGTWHGSSLCVDKKVDVACRDEEVIYVIDSAAGPSGPVRWQADKIVNGTREYMGTFRPIYDSTAHKWFADLNARVHGRWSFAVRGDSIVGDLSELAARRLIRRIAAGRCNTGIPQCPK